MDFRSSRDAELCPNTEPKRPVDVSENAPIKAIYYSQARAFPRCRRLWLEIEGMVNAPDSFRGCRGGLSTKFAAIPPRARRKGLEPSAARFVRTSRSRTTHILSRPQGPSG